MADVDRDQHWPWLGYALDEALRLGLTRPDDVIHYATPEVMAAQLPHDLMATVLTKALAAGRLDAAAILETATAAQLAEHLEPEILWRCLDDVVALSELATDAGGSRARRRGAGWGACSGGRSSRGLSSRPTWCASCRRRSS